MRGNALLQKEKANLRPFKKKFDFQDFSSKNNFAGEVHKVTDKGVPIVLKKYHNTEEGIKEPWVTHTIYAEKDDQEAGYICVAYIPEVKFNKYFSSATKWKLLEGGKGFRVKEVFEKEEADWTDKDYDQLIQATDINSRFPTSYSHLSLAELKEEWDKREEKMNYEYKEEYENFKHFHVNKPHLDYVEVYQDHFQLSGFRHRGKQSDFVTKEDFAFKGIGTSLYLGMSEWLQEEGMSLHASQIQSEDAQAVWQKFEERGLVHTDGERRILRVS